MIHYTKGNNFILTTILFWLSKYYYQPSGANQVESYRQERAEVINTDSIFFTNQSDLTKKGEKVGGDGGAAERCEDDLFRWGSYMYVQVG